MKYSSPPFSMADRKVEPISDVSKARSAGSYEPCARPASIRAKSRRVFTSF